MPTSIYEAMDQQGRSVKDEVEAKATKDALAIIRNLGFFPTRIHQKPGTSIDPIPTEPMRVRVCPAAECGHQNQPNAKHCARCGSAGGVSTDGRGGKQAVGLASPPA